MERQKTNKNIILGGIILAIVVLSVFYFKNNTSTVNKIISLENIPENIDTTISGEEKTRVETENIALQDEINTGDCAEGEEKTTCFEEYLQLGINYELTGELLKAITAYQNAAEISPESYIPYSNAGSIYRQNKDYVRAEAAFKYALELDPLSLSVYTKLYELYRYDLKKYPHEIMPFFAEALDKTGNDFGVILLYAGYLYDVNDYSNALIVWKSLAEAFPDNSLYQDKVDILEAKVKAEQEALQG